MKLPNCENVIVDPAKVLDYLLNPKHPCGAGKARFFSEFGFCIERWKQLAEALREHGWTHDVALKQETGFGPRYVVQGELDTPVGLRPNVRTIWQLDQGAMAPRLITAYPLEEKHDQRT